LQIARLRWFLFAPNGTGFLLREGADFLLYSGLINHMDSDIDILIFFHLVLIIKYRRKVIDNTISDRLKEIFFYIAPNYHITLIEWNHDIDHVHILYKAHPNTEHSKFINAYKSASSRLIKKEFESIRKKLWKEYFWSKSFCLLTTGGAPIDVIKKYIESQGEQQ
jgi:putative transposase